MVSKSLNLDRFIILFASVCTVALTYLLFNEDLLFNSDSNSNQPTVGTIQNVKSDARKKSSDSFTWRSAKKESQVHLLDSLFTGDGSAMTVTLNDGNELTLQENSLITLKKDNGQLLLDLKFGKMTGEIAQDTPITVRVNGHDFELQNDSSGKSKIEIQKTPLGTIEAKSNKGQVLVKNKEKPKERIILSENQKANVQNGIVAPKEVVQPELKLTATPPPMSYITSEKQRFAAKWIAKNLTESHLVILEKKSQQKIYTTKLSGSAIEFDQPQVGQYEIYLEGFDENGKLITQTEKYNFEVAAIPKPEFVNWNDNVTIETRPGKNGLVTGQSFEWTADASLEKYQFQFSKDPDFQKTLVDQEVTAKKMALQNLMSGDYQARVRGWHTKSQTWSSWATVQLHLLVKERSLIKPRSPILAKKNIEIDLRNTERLPANSLNAAIAWKNLDPQSQKYILEIASNKKFESPERIETKSLNLEYNKIDTPKKYFRVFAVGEEGTLSDPSEVGQINVMTGAPILSQIASLSAKAKKAEEAPPHLEANLKWTPVPFSNGYQVEVSDEPEFKKPLSFEFKNESNHIPISKPGQYFVRVRALASVEPSEIEKNENSKISNIQKFIYDFTPMLIGPALKEPMHKSTIFLQSDGAPFVWLEWKKVEYAAQYQLEIALDSSFKKTIFSNKLSETRYLIKDKVPYGPLFWRVRAIDSKKKIESDWSENRQFFIYQKSNNRFDEQ